MAGGSSRFSARMNSARVMISAVASFLRQTRTTELARALVPEAIMPVRHFSANWPSADNRISSLNNSLKKRCPTSRTDTFLLDFALLECIVDRCRVVIGAIAAPYSPIASRHSIQEKCLCCFFAAMPVWSRNQLFRFWSCDSTPNRSGNTS